MLLFKDQAQGITIKGKKLVIERVKKGEEMKPMQPVPVPVPKVNVQTIRR